MKAITLSCKLILVLLTIFNLSFAQTKINVLPKDTVEVGEEVYFDAIYYSTQVSDTLEFEWDFGDGYRLYADSDGNPFETGLCVVHHFMNPGTYNVKLTGTSFNMSTNPPIRISKIINDSITVTVTGTAPLAGFELRHAPFHARTSQYIFAVVPNDYSPSQVTARVERKGGGYSQELTGNTIDNKQRFLLNNSSLPSGDYVLTVELKNGGTVISSIREKFSKPYDGAPKVGINENNAFVLNGTTLFFPIGPFMLNKNNLLLWNRVANTLHTEGWYETHSPLTWADYINEGNKKNLMSVGPVVWKDFKTTPYTRNSHPDSLLLYVQQAKNTDGLLGWCWDDEPELGGRYTRVPAPVLAGWDYRTRMEDPQHPTAQQFYGFNWLQYVNNNPLTGEHPYSYMRNSYLFGGKKTFLADFYTDDAYLMEYKEHISFDNPNRGIVDLWLEGLDNYTWNMDNLVPLGTFIEPQNVTAYERMSGTTYLTEWDAGPTPGDVRTQAWGAVVHGMKYVGYFQFFAPTPADNLSAMAEFKEAVTALTPIILSAPSTRTVSHNCNTRGNRVDIMVREKESDLYIFAVRVSEPESEWNEVYEPETINLELNTGTSISTAYDELTKYQMKYLKLDASEGQTSFNCTVPEGGITPNSIIISAIRNAKPSTMPDSLYDRWTGKGYPTAYDKIGNLRYGFDDGSGNILPLYEWENVTGSVNYSTGQIQFNFTQGIPAGKEYVQIAYAPANREARAISMDGGVIRDQLERNAVRIYRIPAFTNTETIKKEKETSDVLQYFPNPFHEFTNIQFELAEQGKVTLKVYDMNGREISTLVNETKPAGTHQVIFHAENLPAGIYFCRLTTGRNSSVKRMVLVK